MPQTLKQRERLHHHTPRLYTAAEVERERLSRSEKRRAFAWSMVPVLILVGLIIAAVFG